MDETERGNMALSAPQQNGDQLNQSDVENHTMIVCPLEHIPHIPTVHTKPGEQSPAIRVNVVDFADPSGVPVKYSGVLWFGVISNSLKRQIGETVLARMSKGQATPGKNPPWQLADVMGEQAWVDYANSWLATEEGQAWELDNINEVNRLANQAANAGQVAGAAAPTQQAPASQGPPPAWATAPATPAPAAPPTPPAPAGPPASPPAAPAAASAPAGPPTASAPAALPAGLEALIAAMPADQQAAARALMAAQAGASS